MSWRLQTPYARPLGPPVVHALFRPPEESIHGPGYRVPTELFVENEEPVDREDRDRQLNSEDPPPYRPPYPEKDEDVEAIRDECIRMHRTGLDKSYIIARLDKLVRQPLSDTELGDAQSHFEEWSTAYNPGRKYKDEAESERTSGLQNDPNSRDPKIRKFYHGRAGRQRASVAIRHRIKKRWERLGVWNPEWGIPGRVNEGPQDKPQNWKWRWQGDVPDRGVERSRHLPDHPNSRAIRLRQGLRRGERGPLPPRHNLAPDASQSVAESFIISRPWYTYELDVEDERVRSERVPLTMIRFYDTDYMKAVTERWKETGDIVPFERHASWKWQHESPSPEPEELAKIEFTPSEVDALEAIPPPSPPPPPPPPPSPGRRVMVPGTENEIPPRFVKIRDLQPDNADDEPPPLKLPPTDRRGRPRRKAVEQARRDASKLSEAAAPRRSARIAAIAEKAVLEAEAATELASRARALRSRKGIPSSAKKTKAVPASEPRRELSKGNPPAGAKPKGIKKRRRPRRKA